MDAVSLFFVLFCISPACRVKESRRIPWRNALGVSVERLPETFRDCLLNTSRSCSPPFQPVVCCRLFSRCTSQNLPPASEDRSLKNCQYGTEGQKFHQDLAPVLAMTSGNSLAFSRKTITSTDFYRCCAPTRQHQQR